MGRKFGLRCNLVGSEYMNELAERLNIFNDEYIVKFLRQDYNSLFIIQLREATEHYFQDQRSQMDSSSLTLTKSKSNYTETNNQTMSNIAANHQKAGDIHRIFNEQNRLRKQSQDDYVLTHHKFMNINVKPKDPWAALQFENEDDRIGSFLDYLHKDQDN